MRIHRLAGAGASLLALLIAGCGDTNKQSSPSTQPPDTVAAAPTDAPAAATTVPSGAVDPNAPEVVEPGDIPDNQVFVPYAAASGAFAVDVPEGWARTVTDGTVTFTDNYNSITISFSSVARPPTVASVRSGGLADVSGDGTFRLVDVSEVDRKSGHAILAKYEIGSAPNPVTGRKAVLAVERYVFFHSGTEVVLTLSGAKGADNVDPWRIVTDSLTWT